MALKDISADAASLAIIKLVATSVWPPTVAEIRQKVQSLYYEALSIQASSPFENKDSGILAAAERIRMQTSAIRGDSISEPSIETLLSTNDFTNLLNESKQKQCLPENGGV